MTSESRKEAIKKYQQSDSYKNYRNTYMKRWFDNVAVIECECGREIKEHNMKRHLESNIHTKRLMNQEEKESEDNYLSEE